MDPDQLKKTLASFANEQRKTPEDSLGSDHSFSTKQTTNHNPQTLYSWEGPLRAYKKRSAGVLRFYATIAILLSLIALFFREFIVIIPIWAVMFLVYVMTITPPPRVKHSITRFGLQTSRTTYLWENLSHFYFIKKFDYDILVLFLREQYEHPLYIVLPNEKVKNDLFQILSEKIIFVEHPRMNMTDKIAEWLTTLMPEEENPTAS